MPGQGKRKRKRERERARAEAARPTGRWQRVWEGDSDAELRAVVRRLYAEDPDLAPDDLRIDMFCGRLVNPTGYAVSLFVPDPVV
ncbi:hypothetical protein [Streptomyces sp. NPDC093225]|uniref:hypothetical protein n=1 Tax=Streptomyces sp. NPDC093225 TaxID=3366034 RepID=UPI003825B85D